MSISALTVSLAIFASANQVSLEDACFLASEQGCRIILACESGEHELTPAVAALFVAMNEPGLYGVALA